MISFPLNVVFTVAFAVTGLICLFHLLSTGQRGGVDGTRRVKDGWAIDVNHMIMSAAMIWMTWVAIGSVLLWGLAAVFVVLILSLIPSWRRAASVGDRVNVLGHVLLDLAMIWMLVAMPLLMAGMGHGDGSGMGDMEMPMPGTPVWADVVNLGFVVICGIAAVWWLSQVVRGTRHRWHAACHVLMAVAMGVMLVAMNA